MASVTLLSFRDDFLVGKIKLKQLNFPVLWLSEGSLVIFLCRRFRFHGVVACFLGKLVDASSAFP